MDPVHYTAIVKAFSSKYKAKHIIVFFYPNDNIQSLLYKEESYYFKYYWGEQNRDYFNGDNK